MQLLLGRARVGAELVDEAHVAAGGARAVEHDVARARHRHQVRSPATTTARSARRAKGSRAAGSGRRPSGTRWPRYQQSGPPAPRASTRPMPAWRERRARTPGWRDSISAAAQGLAPVHEVDEGVGAGRDHLDRVALHAEGVAHHPVDRDAARDAVEGPGGRLPVVRQDVEVVTQLGEPADDARELLDRAVHAAERAKGEPVRGPEGVREHVVVEEVHVDRGHPAVEIGGDQQREELPRPDGHADVDAPAPRWRGGAGRARRGARRRSAPPSGRGSRA